MVQVVSYSANLQGRGRFQEPRFQDRPGSATSDPNSYPLCHAPCQHLTPAPPIGLQLDEIFLLQQAVWEPRFQRSARKRHFRSKLLPAVSCAMPACDPCSTDRTPDWTRYSCSNKQSGNQGFKIGQEAPPPALIVSAKCASGRCDVEVVVVRLQGRPRQLPDRMRYSCFDNRSGGNQDIKIGRTSYGPRNTICGGSSKVGCAIGFQGVANGSTSARPHTLI